MSRIHTQLPEDVLTVRGNGMNTGEALVGNLFRSLTLSDSLYNLSLCLSQDTGADG